jgi:hypothetical protein
MRSRLVILTLLGSAVPGLAQQDKPAEELKYAP